MRIADLDRDHSQIFLDDVAPDSAFLCSRMESALFEALELRPGARVLDVAAGLGQDTRSLAERGFYATGAEPSKLLTELERMLDEREQRKSLGAFQTRVRAWGEALPFGTGTFEAAFCKGSLDHFDDPVACVREMARVTRSDGRVGLAVANMEAGALRFIRWRDRIRPAGGTARRQRSPARRHWDAPADHITRYDAELLREQLSRHLHIDVWLGISMFWGLARWQQLLRAVPPNLADLLLAGADQVGRRLPQFADVLIVAGRPRAETHA